MVEGFLFLYVCMYVINVWLCILCIFIKGFLRVYMYMYYNMRNVVLLRKVRVFKK